MTMQATPRARRAPSSAMGAFLGKVETGFPLRKCDNAEMLERFQANAKPL
jgi:hypothetical protein